MHAIYLRDEYATPPAAPAPAILAMDPLLALAALRALPRGTPSMAFLRVMAPIVEPLPVRGEDDASGAHTCMARYMHEDGGSTFYCDRVTAHDGLHAAHEAGTDEVEEIWADEECARRREPVTDLSALRAKAGSHGLGADFVDRELQARCYDRRPELFGWQMDVLADVVEEAILHAWPDNDAYNVSKQLSVGPVTTFEEITTQTTPTELIRGFKDYDTVGRGFLIVETRGIQEYVPSLQELRSLARARREDSTSATAPLAAPDL
jgi:hypothetical protein